MSKILYPIFNLPNENDAENEAMPTWIKWWMINNYKKRNWILSEIITGNPLSLENSVKTKFYLPPLPRGNSEQEGEPSPTNEVPIQNVTGDVEVLVQNKNWFDINKVTSQYITDRGTNYITSSFPSSYKDGGNISIPLYNKNYKFSGNCTAGRFELSLFLNGEKIGNTQTSTTGFTINNTQGLYDTAQIILSNGTSTGSITFSNMQLEEGTTATTYTPHQEQTLPLTLGNIELCKIGTAQDYFYKDNGKWYLYKAIGKAVFDGSSDEDWSHYSTSSAPFRIVMNDIQPTTNDNINPNIKCSHFVSIYWNANFNEYNSLITMRSNNNYLAFRDTDITRLADWKTWLSTHNVTVEYELATPTSTEITDTTLIEQLDSISNVLSYEEQTNISGTSSEAEPLFEVQYYMINESEGE